MTTSAWIAIIGLALSHGVAWAVASVRKANRDGQIEQRLKAVERTMSEFRTFEQTRHDGLDDTVGAIRRNIVLIASKLNVDGIEK